MAATYVSDVQSGAVASSGTLSVTVAAGSDRVLVICLGWYDSAKDITTLTYPVGGVATAATLAAGSDTTTNRDYRSAIYTLVNPDVGTANVAWAVSGGAAYMEISAVAVSDAHQSSTVAFAAEDDENSADTSIVMTNASGDLVVDCVRNGNTTVGSDQTILWTAGGFSALGTFRGSMATAVNPTLTWNHDGTRIVHSAVSIAVAGGAPVSPDSVFPVSRREMHHYRRDIFRRRMA